MQVEREKDIAQRELERLAVDAYSDLAAWAGHVAQGRKTRWLRVYGGRSSRLARMEVKPGAGIAGLALRHGVPCLASGEINAYLLAECPVLLAERLTSGIAFPLPTGSGGRIGGILLLGRRESVPFRDSDIRAISDRLPNWIDLSAGWRYDGGN